MAGLLVEHLLGPGRLFVRAIAAGVRTVFPRLVLPSLRKHRSPRAPEPQQARCAHAASRPKPGNAVRETTMATDLLVGKKRRAVMLAALVILALGATVAMANTPDLRLFQSSPPTVSPVADFYWYPADPSKYDSVQFCDNSYDPAYMGFSELLVGLRRRHHCDRLLCKPPVRGGRDYTVGHKVQTTDGRTDDVTKPVIVQHARRRDHEVHGADSRPAPGRHGRSWSGCATTSGPRTCRSSCTRATPTPIRATLGGDSEAAGAGAQRQPDDRLQLQLHVHERRRQDRQGDIQGRRDDPERTRRTPGRQHGHFLAGQGKRQEVSPADRDPPIRDRLTLREGNHEATLSGSRVASLRTTVRSSPPLGRGTAAANDGFMGNKAVHGT